MVIVSLIAAAVLLGGAWILGAGAADEDVHMRSVFIDTLADAAAAGVAIAGAIIVLTGGNFWLDPVLALFVATVVSVAAVQLLRDAIRVMRGENVVFDRD